MVNRLNGGGFENVNHYNNVILTFCEIDNIHVARNSLNKVYQLCLRSKIMENEKREDEVVNAILRGKVHDEMAYILGGVAGHAGLFSCVKDLSHFIKMILNDGVYNGKQIFSRATIDLMFTPQVRVPNGVSLDLNQRGLGWIVKGDFCSAGDLASEQTILHTGFTGTNIFVDRVR